jgi:Ca2+:H+ antiporter
VSRVYLLAVFIPVAVALKLGDAPATAVFFTAALGIVPTAFLMSDATEALADRAGPGIGGLLNVTFGNAPELIIAFFALNDGLQEVVKASLVGSIIGNTLLVLGFSMAVGGWRRERQFFSREAAHRQSLAVLLAVAALVVPALGQLIFGGGHLPAVSDLRRNFGGGVEGLSLGIAAVLVATYVVVLSISLRTRRGIFSLEAEDDPDEEIWPVQRSVALLAVAGVLVGVMSEVLVSSIEEASRAIGLSPFFVAVFVVGIVGNAAEHWVAVVVAAKNKMDLAVSIALGSSAQIAMFVTPLLVLLSFVVGPHPMALVFNAYELAAIVSAAVIAYRVASRGVSTRFEGLQLLTVYLVLAVVFILA